MLKRQVWMLKKAQEANENVVEKENCLTKLRNFCTASVFANWDDIFDNSWDFCSTTCRLPQRKNPNVQNLCHNHLFFHRLTFTSSRDKICGQIVQGNYGWISIGTLCCSGIWNFNPQPGAQVLGL